MKTPLIATFISAALGAMQLIPVTVSGAHRVAPAGGISLQAPAPIYEVMNRACLNCHSSRSRLPWYGKVAPISWMVARDVERARKAVNFSDWAEQSGAKPYAAMGTLMAACADLKSGRMPTAPYRLMHPEARLSRQEVESFCAWSKDETRRLRESVQNKRNTR